MKKFIKSVLKKLFLPLYCIVVPENYIEYKKKKKITELNKIWREKNSHNFTKIGNEISELVFPIEKVKVGNFTYGALKVFSYNSLDENLEIGSFCSIAPNVKFILGGMHNYHHFSTYPFKAYFKNESESFSKGSIIVEDDVWIGTDSIIMSGVKLAKGTVVAAGSVVVKSTEPYSIIGGNPAALIKFRFSEDLVINLEKIDFSKLTKEFIVENLNLLYQYFDYNLLNIIIKKMNE